jgi:hypothetical protein
MTVTQLQRALDENRIDETAYRILPTQIVEGPLCLLRSGNDSWRVVYVDRGEFMIDRYFEFENDACGFFLKNISWIQLLERASGTFPT